VDRSILSRRKSRWQWKLTPELCVIATYREGYLIIRASPGIKYALCGGFGVGDNTTIEKSEQMIINGKNYTAQGWELYKQEGNGQVRYSEFLFVDLEDGIHIAYGGPVSGDAVNFEEYLTIKETLLRILASYHTMN
jgi:hypothetical protein